VVERSAYGKAIGKLTLALGQSNDLTGSYLKDQIGRLPARAQQVSRELAAFTAGQLLQAGPEAVNDAITKLIMPGIINRATPDALVATVRTKLVEEQALRKRLETAVVDATEQASRNYLQTVSADLNLRHFFFKGTLIDTSRGFCRERVGKYYTEEEVKAWAALTWSGKNPATDEQTIFTLLGGYRCRHRLVPVTKSLYEARTGKAGAPAPTPTPPTPAAPQAPPPFKASPPTPRPAPPLSAQQLRGLEAAGVTVNVPAEKRGDFLRLVNGSFPGLNLPDLFDDVAQIAKEVGFKWDKMAVSALKFEPGFRVELSYTDEDGKELAVFRDFLFKNGKRTLYNNLLIIPPKWQETGAISRRILHAFYKQARNAKVDEITVYAALENGGYAWARYGFMAVSEYEVRNVLDYARDKVSRPVWEAMTAIVEDHYKASPNAPFPMRRLTEIPGAKDGLLGSSWHGELRLNDPRQRLVYESYLYNR